MNSWMKNNLLLVAGMAMLGAIGAAIFTHFPEYYFPLYTAIPLFFIVIGIISMQIMRKAASMEAQKFQMLFLLNKVIKFFTIIIICVVYALFVKENLISFLLTFSLFYIVYTILEVIVSININKDLKQ
jgi:hypothetical protein